MRKIISVLLAAVLLVSCAACGKQNTPPTEPSNVPTDATNPPEQTQPAASVPQGTPDYFQLSICYEDGTYVSLSAFADGNGMITVDYQGDIRKMTAMELSVMDQIGTALADSGLAALNGQNLYEEGSMASASMYVSYPDGNYLGAGYTGTIPQAFLDGYNAMDTWFRTLLADVPEYVPRPVVMGEVNEKALAEFEAILDASGIQPLDMFSICDVPKDEYFAMTLGLSSGDGIANGTICNPMMSATAYSCVIVTLEDTGKVAAVQKDFAANVDWNRWVCVMADKAMVAQKGDMLICLVGAADMYQQTAAAIESTGWTILETLKRS